MTRHADERIATALRDAQAPAESQAEERGFRVVRDAFAERQPTPPRFGTRVRLGLGAAAAGLVAALALTPAGADVREWIADAIEVGEEDARPVIGSLPAPGSVLVEGPGGAWVLNEDGSRRRLGDYEHATWSAKGNYVGASDGRELFAVTLQGHVQWTVTAPKPIESLDWSTGEGYRIAYVSGLDLWVVAGDGTGEARVTGPVGSTAIAWRPESGETRHELAYIDSSDRVTLRDTDAGRVLWRSEQVPAPVESLQWSDDGERLLVEAEGFAVLLDADGQSVVKGPIAIGSDAALAPDGRHVAVVRPARRGSAELALLPTSPNGEPERALYPTARGAGGLLGSPSFSPDGEWILLPWPQADQWLFIRLADRRVVPVGDIARQLDADRRGDATLPRVAGWCC